MLRDPLYRAIEERLSGALDPELFERCAAELLRTAYPGLAAVRGGHDAGMDGSIPGRTSSPLPMICTTSADVLRNLTRSLESYLANGGESRLAVLVTNQALTPKRRRNLEKRAKELGFTLRNVHAHDDIAGRLYHAPKWRIELLGLAGEPPAISTLPRSRRPFAAQPLIGREHDFAWLMAREGDCLLVGQPGSGKTAILASLALAGEGAFLISEDRGEIADAMRELNPKRIFVDDAHRRHDLLVELRGLREDIGAEFSIIATCWPAEREMLQRSLGLASEDVHQLPLLPRTVMADIVKAVGVRGPDVLVAEIIDQSAGLPGLAVTLAQLSIRLGTADLARGEFLLRDIVATLGELVGERAVPVLAAFSVGGRSGMALIDVSEALGIPATDVWDIVTRIESGGVLKEIGRGALAVKPAALREALVREVFFSGPRSMPISALLPRSPSAEHTAETLIRSRTRGTKIPDDLIRDLLEKCVPDGPWPGQDKKDAWLSYAYSGPESVDWILDKYPHVLGVVARAGLVHRPKRIVSVLLDAAVGDERELPPNPDHPLRVIGDWIKAGRPGTSVALGRRRALLDALKDWASRPGADPRVVRRTLAIVFSPKYEVSPADRIDLRTVRILTGHLTEGELATLSTWWTEAVAILSLIGVEDIRDLEPTVQNWAFPGRLHGKVSTGVAAVARAGAARMIEDIARLGEQYPAVVAWASRLAQRAKLRISLPAELDSAYQVLFPREEYTGNWQSRYERQHRAAARLGALWASESVEAVAARLVRYDREGRRIGRSWPRLTDIAARALAEGVSQPLEWVEALVRERAQSDLVAPFLERLFDKDDNEAEGIWFRLFDNDAYRYLCLHLALCSPRSSERMLERTLVNLDQAEQLVEVACMRGEIPLERVIRLLDHPSGTVAAATAKGVWHVYDQGRNIPHELHASWRRAVVQHVRAEYPLQEIFQRDPELAKEWLLARQGDDPFSGFRDSEPFEHAVAALDYEARCQLIDTVDRDFGPPGFFGALVGDDLELFRALLNRADLRHRHLDPLEGRQSSSWIELARLALDSGYSPEDIADAVHERGWSWVGKESSMWESWAEFFRPLKEHDDERVREIGRIGRESAGLLAAAAQEREHDEEVYGFD